MLELSLTMSGVCALCMRVCCLERTMGAGASRPASTRWLGLVRAMREEGLARVCRRGRGSLKWWWAQHGWPLGTSARRAGGARRPGARSAQRAAMAG